MSSKPKVGDVLNCEDGTAIVIERGSDPVLALIELVAETYGGEPFAADNQAIVAAMAKTRVATWFYNTANQLEGGDIDPDQYAGGWWSPDGAGKRFIDVLWFDGSAYTLGDEASEAAEGIDEHANQSAS